MSVAAASTTELNFLKKTVTVSPLVLLSVVDHFNRVAKDNSGNQKKRVVGVILGDNSTETIKVTNSYAIPFEEDDKNPGVWFLDHNYIDSMGEMFKKINAKEKLIGWYHSGPKLRASDLKINDLFRRYTPNPLLLIVDVHAQGVGIPTDAYFAVDDIKNDGSAAEKTFIHVPSLIEAEEAEEIGVEHLLRDIRDQAAGNLSLRVTQTYQSLLGLHQKLRDIATYLEKVYNKNLPINHTILGKLQNVFNLLPNLVQPAGSSAIIGEDTGAAAATATATATVGSASVGSELATAFTVKTNDELMIIYISTLVRAIIAFHDLIENKLENKRLNEKKALEAEESLGEDKNAITAE
ncbi:RPN8 [Candida theae]|uniref:26S proteasome regulatory subunit RPN8 n=1 Tax=Candida theae TaxID=1198502 RepID=A0AAD5BCE0_9ASCO|nr:RPN8 [Candida theae]KAI5950373.1 RPN8 [Candida theae]